ncbi:DNA-binding transcriptional LysR family regulator [Paenibacillus sp. W4I10]|nr:DNA-binding transcriptional LysR family regulator [Paenibacillus sp. W4I10]
MIPPLTLLFLSIFEHFYGAEIKRDVQQPEPEVGGLLLYRWLHRNDSQLTHDPFLSLKSGCERPVMRAFQENGLTLNKQFEVTEHSTILSMVEAGIGVAVIPSMILTAVPLKIMIKPLSPPINRDIGLAVLSMQNVSSAVSEFIKFAQMQISS